MWEICAENLQKDYGSEKKGYITKAVQNVSLTFPEGSITAICGKSGCGKSTLLSMLGGLTKPTAGVVRIGETELYRLKENALARFRGEHIGFVFQSYQLLPELTVCQNIRMGCLINKRPVERQDVIQICEKLELEDKLDQYPSELSGGQQQRVSLARALLKQPKLLLCDEPTGNLDQASGEIVIRELLTLARAENKTVVIVTHDPEIARRCDRVCEMADGRMLA